MGELQERSISTGFVSVTRCVHHCERRRTNLRRECYRRQPVAGGLGTFGPHRGPEVRVAAYCYQPGNLQRCEYGFAPATEWRSARESDQRRELKADGSDRVG